MKETLIVYPLAVCLSSFSFFSPSFLLLFSEEAKPAPSTAPPTPPPPPICGPLKCRPRVSYVLRSRFDRAMGNVSGREEGADGVDGASYGRSDGGSDRIDAADSGTGDSIVTGVRPPGHAQSYESIGNVFPPASPSRSRSPHLFAPQHPVAPLQRADSPLFNPMWRNETNASVNSPPEKGVPTLITWGHGGDNVMVEGSWDNWTSRKVLQRTGKDHSLLLVLPSGIFHYRFIVDGETRHSSELPFVSDEMGNVCHVLDVHECVPECLDSVAGFEVPSSPDSEYSQEFPEEDEFSRDPLVVPSQLHLTVLDVTKPSEVSSTRPQHVGLNHLYMEKGWASQSVVALGLTHRFESKYVTVVLYKPVSR